MKKIYTIILCTVLCSFLLTGTALAADTDNMMNDVGDAVSTAEDMMEDAVTDIKDAMDPNDGDPEAESDGIVDGSDLDNNGETGDTTNEQPTTDNNNDNNNDNRDTTENGSETTGVIDGMDLEEKGINPWAIVIAVIVVIAVLILIFVLIPKRRR